MNRNSELLHPRTSRRSAREPSLEVHISLRVGAPQTYRPRTDFDAEAAHFDLHVPGPTGITPLANEVSVAVQIFPPARKRSSNF